MSALHRAPPSTLACPQDWARVFPSHRASANVLHQAYELSVLTGTQVLLLVVSETGLVYTFTTPKLQPLVTKPEGKNLIQVCCTASAPCRIAPLTLSRPA